MYFYIYIDFMYILYICSIHTQEHMQEYIGTTKIILFFFDVIFCPKPAISWFYCSWHVFATQHCQKITI